MILLLLAGLGASSETVPYHQAYEAYGRCIREHIRTHRHEIASLGMLRDFAIPFCNAERANFVSQVADSWPEGDPQEKRERAEAAASILERYLPAVFEETIRLVPRNECSAGLKVQDHCLE